MTDWQQNRVHHYSKGVLLLCTWWDNPQLMQVKKKWLWWTQFHYQIPALYTTKNGHCFFLWLNTDTCIHLCLFNMILIIQCSATNSIWQGLLWNLLNKLMTQDRNRSAAWIPTALVCHKKRFQHLKCSLIFSPSSLCLCQKQAEHVLKGDSPLSVFKGSVSL